MLKLIGFCGIKSAGKDTAWLALENLGYQRINFSDPVKDCVAIIYGWPRHLLEGDTLESRIWRETNDPWWANKLGRESFTPRNALDEFGKEARDHINADIFLFALERKIEKAPNGVVFTGVRFSNEINFIRNNGGKVFEIQRGKNPIWYNTAVARNKTKDFIEFTKYTDYLENLGINNMDYSWVGLENDGVVLNDGSPADLHEKILARI